MANKLYEENDIQDIANAIRGKTGKSNTMKVSQMASEISGIETETAPKLQDKVITENGTYSADSGFDGLGSVTVEVASAGGGSGGGNPLIINSLDVQVPTVSVTYAFSTSLAE